MGPHRSIRHAVFISDRSGWRSAAVFRGRPYGHPGRRSRIKDSLQAPSRLALASPRTSVGLGQGRCRARCGMDRRKVLLAAEETSFWRRVVGQRRSDHPSRPENAGLADCSRRSDPSHKCCGQPCPRIDAAEYSTASSPSRCAGSSSSRIMQAVFPSVVHAGAPQAWPTSSSSSRSMPVAAAVARRYMWHRTGCQSLNRHLASSHRSIAGAVGSPRRCARSPRWCNS
jgi:hypothetical protein